MGSMCSGILHAVLCVGLTLASAASAEDLACRAPPPFQPRAPVPVCPSGQLACGDTCVDLERDARHCGACGRDCGAAGVCGNGRCSASAPPQTPACGQGTSFYAGLGPRSVALGDLDGDGDLDVAVGNNGRTESLSHTLYVPGTVVALFNQGHGQLSAPRVLDREGMHPWHVRMVDWEGDGDLDVIAGVRGGLRRFLGDGTGTLAPAGKWGPGGGDVFALALADINTDGRMDAVYSIRNPINPPYLFLELSSRSGTPLRKSYEVSETPALGLGDFNSDGVLDIAHATSGQVSLLASQRDGGAFPISTRLLPMTPGGLVARDFNGDGAVDVALSDSSRDRLVLLYGMGDGRLLAGTAVAVTSRPAALVSGDVDRDGLEDLVVVHPEAKQVGILPGRRDGTFGPERLLQAEGTVRDVAVGDLDGDGVPELVVPEYETNNVRVLRTRCP